MLHVALADDVMPSAFGTAVPAVVEQIWLPVLDVTMNDTLPWLTWPTAGGLTRSVAVSMACEPSKATDSGCAVVVSIRPTDNRAVPVLAAKLLAPL
jgi:hypothetical protein